FGNSDGLLLKPSAMRGLAYLGETWDHYQTICSQRLPRTDSPSIRPTNQLGRSPSPPPGETVEVRGHPVSAMRQKIMDLARLINRADDATFRAKIPSLLAVDEFLRFVAVNSALANFDSFLS